MNPALLNLAERAGWTFVQAVAGLVAVTTVTDPTQFDWKTALAVGGTAAVLSALKTTSVHLTVAGQQPVTVPAVDVQESDWLGEPAAPAPAPAPAPVVAPPARPPVAATAAFPARPATSPPPPPPAQVPRPPASAPRHALGAPVPASTVAGRRLPG